MRHFASALLRTSVFPVSRLVQVVSVGEEVDCIEALDDGVLEVAGAIDKVERAKAEMRTLMPSRSSIRRFIHVSS